MTETPQTADAAGGAAEPSPELLRERLIQAELRAEAARAGMVDLDGIRLLDLAGVKLGPNAEVAEASALIAGLKRDKPYLFARNSSAPVSAPPQAAAGPRRATDMTVEEWRMARAELLRRR